MNQLRALHRAGVMSNNQANQFDRLVKAVEQVRSRPIWTPNTTRQQQVELIEQLRKELNKVFISHFMFYAFTVKLVLNCNGPRCDMEVNQPSLLKI